MMLRHVLSLLRRSPALASMAAAFLVAGAGLAVAAGSDTTIHACVKKGNGALRVVDSAKACRKSERAISFDKRGRTGATGPQGPEGPQGPAGPEGPAGKDAPTAAAPHQAVIGTVRLGLTSGEVDFDITGLDLGLSDPSSASQSTGAGAGKVTFKPIELTKRVDAASPTLMKAVALGTHASHVTIDLQRPGAASPYRRYATPLAIVSKVHQDAPDAGGRPVETVTLQAGALQPQAPADAPARGDAIGHITFHVDNNAADDIGPVAVYGSSFGLSQAGTIGSGTSGAGAGQATFEELTVRKGLDAASQPLFAAVTAGSHWRAATLVLDGGPTYELGAVNVTSLADTATGETPTTPVVETIALHAETYGQSAGGDTACWDTVKNAACGP